MKDGRTHLAYKAEHVVDLETEVIFAAEVYAADAADTATLPTSLVRAQENVDATESGRVIEKAAADKGYHAAETLLACQELGLLGMTTYIPEPAVRRKWTDKPEEEKAAVLNNRRADAARVRQAAAAPAERTGRALLRPRLRHGRRAEVVATRA